MPTKIEGRTVDGRYKPGVDKGSMSRLKIPLPVKKVLPKKEERLDDYIPKQVLRQKQALVRNKIIMSNR